MSALPPAQSPPVITPEREAMLRRLFALLRRGDPRGGVDLPEAPSFIGGFGSDAWWLGDDGHYLLVQIAHDLVGSSIKSSGLSPRAAQNLIARACAVVVRDDDSAGVAFVRDWLARGMRPYLVARPHRMNFPGDSLTVGGCRLQRKLPLDDGPLRTSLKEDFPAFALVAEVE